MEAMHRATVDAEARVADLGAAAHARWAVAWLSGVVVLCLCVVAALFVYLGRLYRYLEDIDTIVLIISNVGILTAGILIGARWMLRQLDDHSSDNASD
jgi:hypothetical protein